MTIIYFYLGGRGSATNNLTPLDANLNNLMYVDKKLTDMPRYLSRKFMFVRLQSRVENLMNVRFEFMIFIFVHTYFYSILTIFDIYDSPGQFFKPFSRSST